MIKLIDLTKSYRTVNGRKYVLRNVNCDFPEDANIGILGRNGAGKSTLIRMLGGIDFPDKGRVVMDKSVSWPLALGGGFQGSLTGRDNARFVCRIYGDSKKDMMRKIAFSEEFADIGDYFDMPVGSYSSGMRSRLAFALSMAFDFDYYLIDEVMSVGDRDFKVKCKAELEAKKGRSKIILVSHDMRSIKEHCDCAAVLENAEMKFYMDVDEAINVYEKQ